MKYAQALDQQRAHLRLVSSAEGVREWYLGHSDPVLARAQHRAIVVTLAAADPYFWSSDLCGLLTEVSASMPRWTLRREALPTDHGFCWFEAPLSLPGVPGHVLAVTWGLITPSGRDPSLGNTVLISVFVDGGPDLPRLRAPVLVFGWHPGDAMGPEDLDVGPASAETDRIRRRMASYVAAIFALLEQKILVTSPAGIDRAAARRLKKAGARRPPAILVVRLRRVAREGDDADGQPRAWSCRWIVRGHWRQQYYPSDGSHRPVFVLPYIKGPDEMPLRAPAERVFAVVR